MSLPFVLDDVPSCPPESCAICSNPLEAIGEPKSLATLLLSFPIALFLDSIAFIFSLLAVKCPLTPAAIFFGLSNTLLATLPAAIIVINDFAPLCIEGSPILGPIPNIFLAKSSILLIDANPIIAITPKALVSSAFRLPPWATSTIKTITIVNTNAWIDWIKTSEHNSLTHISNTPFFIKIPPIYYILETKSYTTIIGAIIASTII